MKWRRLETRREKRERTEREKRQETAQEQRTHEERKRSAESAQACGDAYERRNDSPAAYQAWKTASRHAYGGDPADWEIWRACQRLRDGHPVEMETLVAFLERDPWTFGTGYAKAEIIQELKRREIPPEMRERLRGVVLSAVDGRDRREFRYYCKLARALDTPDLRDALRARLSHPDPGARRRAAWALYACEQKNERQDAEAATK